MSREEELFSAVDALLEQAVLDPLPEPAERKRLREVAGLTQEQIAKALQTRREAVGNWEAGHTEPRPPKRAAYARLLEGLAARFPAPPSSASPAAAPAQEAPAPEAFTGRVSEPTAMTAPENTATAPVVAVRPAASTRPTSTSRRPDAKKAAPWQPPAVADTTDPRFAHGPLAVIDADADRRVTAYCVDGLVLDVPAKSLPTLVEWTLKESQLGAPRLNGSGKDADPLLVFTEAACE
ncbi:helix-turn-helix transcriptional regulator, partial [Streptomyces sp. NPDC020125]|uniref:helix-turn-helix transcriptional regulator n=1 Tax=Streptomyces sp. NPDC020125 TaxID=3154593 RepID=UPI0033EFE7A1